MFGHQYGMEPLVQLPAPGGYVVAVLRDELGAEHPLARESRRKLASALY